MLLVPFLKKSFMSSRGAGLSFCGGLKFVNKMAVAIKMRDSRKRIISESFILRRLQNKKGLSYLQVYNELMN